MNGLNQTLAGIDMPTPDPHLSRQEYIEERRELSRAQQACYEAFEKTLVTLSGSFFVFSIGLLGYLGKEHTVGRDVTKGVGIYLIVSWCALTVSLLILMGCFFVNAKSYTIEIDKLEEALTDFSALARKNVWSIVALCLYAASTVLFFAGVALLALFSWKVFG